jgi:hypothetical protein
MYCLYQTLPLVVDGYVGGSSRDELESGRVNRVERTSSSLALFM